MQQRFSLAFGLLFAILFHIASSEEERTSSALDKFLREKRGKNTVLEWFCDNPDDKECYYVFERAYYVNNKPYVMRSIGVKSNGGISHSDGFFSPPIGLPSEVFNTKNWKLDALFINHDKFYQTFYESPVWSGALEPNSNESLNTLVIGLGGGIMVNYFKAKYPKMKVTGVELNPLMVSMAIEWFDTKVDERLEIHTMNGIEFLVHAAKNGHRYDVVVLDVALSDMTVEFVAPVEDFLDSRTIQMMSIIVKYYGVLSVNLVFGKQYDRIEMLNKIVAMFRPHFKDIEIRMMTYFNNIMVCRHVPIAEPKGYTPPEIQKPQYTKNII